MNEPERMPRTVLPIPDQPHVGLTTFDAKDPDTHYPPIKDLRPPPGAPNVLIVLIDDVGFGASSAFGGPCQTPNFEKLAASGLKYNRFHTTALCSPTRQALLTGRNHHSAGMGSITEFATSAPGQCSFMSNTISPMARTLKLNGYSTAQFGKCHEVPVWQTSPMGPFDSWPTGGGGFEYFYGFIGGETNQYYPAIYEGTTPVEPAKTPEAYNHYAVGWAHAMDTPYQWTKQVASHWGGTRNGLIVHWPKGIKAKGEIRGQFHHVIDVAPTLLEVAGLPQPVFVNGVQQRPIEGVSMAYSFDDARAPERHETQYFEMNGNRGIYHKGWTAVTKHRTPWLTGEVQLPAFDEDIWELYDTNTDWSQAHNLAPEMPDKLHELQRLWLIEAVKYNVLPLDDRFAERANPDIAGRPQLVKGHRQLLFGGMGRLTESSIISYKNKSHAVTADVEVPPSGAEGVIIAVGGLTGGWSLYAKDGKPKYCYNFYGLNRYTVEGTSEIPPGKHQVRMEFEYDGGGLAKGGTVTLYLDGKEVGAGRVDQTEPFVFSADETCDVGNEFGSPVTPDYPARKKFSGEVNWVEIDVGKDAEDLDHLITPDERLQLAMAIQ